MGGLVLKILKKLNGDKFGLPWASMVLAKAMGLGATAEESRACNCWMLQSLGSKEVMVINIKQN
jgi:hypothetical protein